MGTGGRGGVVLPDLEVPEKPNMIHPLAEKQVKCLPGSPEKIAVMSARLQRGEQLFHPADACFDGQMAPDYVAKARRKDPAACRRARKDLPKDIRTIRVIKRRRRGPRCHPPIGRQSNNRKRGRDDLGNFR